MNTSEIIDFENLIKSNKGKSLLPTVKSFELQLPDTIFHQKRYCSIQNIEYETNKVISIRYPTTKIDRIKVYGSNQIILTPLPNNLDVLYENDSTDIRFDINIKDELNTLWTRYSKLSFSYQNKFISSLNSLGSNKFALQLNNLKQ